MYLIFIFLYLFFWKVQSWYLSYLLEDVHASPGSVSKNTISGLPELLILFINYSLKVLMFSCVDSVKTNISIKLKWRDVQSGRIL